jgi:signal peptidase
MRRARREADDADVDDASDGEEPVPRLPRSSRSRPPKRSIRPWGHSDEADSGGAKDEEEGPRVSDVIEPRRPVFFRARDSVYFEPLLALCVVAVLLASLYGYAMNWPPIYVVESSSMQHGDSDQVGLLNAGDLVLAKRVNPPGDVTTYYEGLPTGYTTYGEYGDVILYNPDGLTGGTPIIHRAITWVVWNQDGTYSLPDLVGLPCGFNANALYQVQTPTGCLGSATTQVTGTLNLYNIGWASAKVSLQLQAGGSHSGFLTMGDNNVADGIATPDQPALSEYVEPGWVIGVARGMLPWFGSIKLLLTGDASYVPPQSWEYMALTLIAIVLVAFGIHYALRSAGIEDERRKREEEEARRGGGAAPPEPSERPLKAWDVEQSDEDEKGRRRKRPPRSTTGREAPSSSRHGRPPPQTRRDARSDSSSKKRRADEDDE